LVAQHCSPFTRYDGHREAGCAKRLVVLVFNFADDTSSSMAS
jgi:hypothetical protein